MTLEAVEELFRKCVADILSKICKNLLKHVKHVEKSYWKTDRIIGAKLDRLQIALGAEDNKDDSDSEDIDSTEDEKVQGSLASYFSFLFQEFYCHSNSFSRFSPIKMILYTLINKIVAKSFLHELWPY